MKLSILIALGVSSIALGVIVFSPKDGAEVEDTYMEPTAILQKYGYPAENHTVQTDDGYILTLHRIPYGKKCSSASRGPVFLQHGMLGSSVDWFITGTEKGLAYILADNCYDVWLGNSRGNKYSKYHVSLDYQIDAEEYWDFDWHEKAVYDIPISIDKILHESGWDDLLYIGYSEGTTQFLVFNTLRTEYSKKVRAAFLLSPVAYLGHTRIPTLELISRFPEWALENIGYPEFHPTDEFLAKAGGEACLQGHPAVEEMCSNDNFIVCGFDSVQLNDTMTPIYLGHVPAGASTREFLHYAQLYISGKFRHYDYGITKNQIIYGSIQPPDYDLSKVTVPTFLLYSGITDMWASFEDVAKLAAAINPEGITQIPSQKFNHLDYILSTNVVPLVYDTLLNIMIRF